jgi:hypothetical protein
MKNKEIHYHHLHVPLIESTSEIILNLSQYLHPKERLSMSRPKGMSEK